MGRSILSDCLGSKSLCFLQQVREEKARLRHETKQTRSRGRTRYGFGQPSQLRARSQLWDRGAAVQGTIPRRCCPHRVGTAAANATSLQDPNMNVVRARQEPLGSLVVQVTSLYRFCKKRLGPGLSPSLLGFFPRQPSVTEPGFVRGRGIEMGTECLRSALWMPSLSSVIS